MNIVLLAGSNVGSKTFTAMSYVKDYMSKNYSEHTLETIDLRDKDLEFSDGRNYLEWTGDTRAVTEQLMNADIIIIGFPVFQASIPATLKNVFDLLPVNALQDKTVSIVSTAGSNKHFLVGEMMLKPILHYMKAHIVQTSVFITESSFGIHEIVDDDIIIRLENLADQTIQIAKAHETMRSEAEEKFGF